MTAPPTGSLVRYQHPSWGPARGRVLRVALDQPGREVLVQDLAPTGAREWWPLADVRAETTEEALIALCERVLERERVRLEGR